MVELNFKVLLLGADIDAVSLIHYSEQRLNVPYRYWKDFNGLIKTPMGWEERAYRMYARDMTIDPKLTLHPVRDELIRQGKYHTLTLNYGQISVVQMSDLVPMIDHFLSKDAYSLMLNRPNM
jgi:aminoglycoside 3-N-acetyltransferase